MTFSDLIKMPTVTSVLLCEITAAVPLQDWVPYNDIWRTALTSAVTLATLDADGVVVTAGASVAAVEATPGRWVQSAGYVYYNPAMGEPYAEVVIGRAVFYFSDLPKAFDNPYEARIKSVPKLSLRIESTFGGVAQIGGGKISFHNEDGFFDPLPVRWDNGVAVLKLGLDLPNDPMDYDDYQTVGTWTLDASSLSDTSFDLSVSERKNNLRATIPTARFTRDTWPHIDDDLVGKPVPTIYGRAYGVTAHLVDPNTNKLKVCSHSIRGFIGLRKREERERTETRTPEWFKVTGQSYYRTATSEDVIAVTCNGVELSEVGTLTLLAAASNSFIVRDNFLYVKAAAVPTTANTTVYVKVNFSAWSNIPFATRDVANGEFTVSSEYWNGEDDLSVDVIGYAVDGEALENPADIIENILETVGETDLDTDSFDAVREYFNLGTDRYGNPITSLKPSLVLDKEKGEAALSVIEDINSICGTYLFVDANGQWKLGVSKPEPAESVDLTEVELVQISSENRTEDLFTSVEVTYAERRSEGWSEILTESNERLRRLAGREVHSVKQIDAALWDEKDAQYLAQRILSTQGNPLLLFKATIPRQGLTLKPGDKVRARRDARGLDELMEVIEVEYSPMEKQASLTLGNQRGWGRSCGFWLADTQPAWDSGASDEAARDAAAESGYWADDNGYADEDDARSRNVSRWW